ncbi:MAG: DUF2304 family protein [Chloroflexota bacterium]|nr:DUF2304 family protein [Chloroflexota bacterium]
MDNVRLIGVLVAVAFAAYGISKYRGGRWAKSDLLLNLLIASGIAIVSVYPGVGGLLTSLFRLQNRLLALLVFSNLLLFGLVFYLLGQVRASSRRSGEIVRAIARRQYQERFGPSSPEGSTQLRGKVLIIIPAYNEQDAIPGVLSRVPQQICGLPVDALVVVDGATDATEAVATSLNVPVATHILRRGQGDALRTGFEIVRAQHAEIVVNMDADGQHQPEELEKLIAPIVRDEADFVMGSRFLGEYEEAGGARHAGILFFSRLISVLSGVRITDSTNGYRAIRGSALERLELREDRFSTAELILEAAKKKLRILEVPVTILRRAEGESKKPKRLGYPLGFLRVIIQTWLR